VLVGGFTGALGALPFCVFEGGGVVVVVLPVPSPVAVPGVEVDAAPLEEVPLDPPQPLNNNVSAATEATARIGIANIG
jgi:hypothetical protein